MSELLYKFFRGFFRLFFAVFYRWEVRGLEHVPDQGGVVVCCNHISNLDPPLVGSAMRRPVRFMAKEELFRVPVLSFLIRNFGAFPVQRDTADKRAVKKALSILKQGGVVGVFPEGTRSKTGELGEAHAGASFIALKGEGQVVPAAIIGPYRLFRKVTIVFGPPLDLSEYQGQKRTSGSLKEVTHRIMGEIDSLLKENRRERP
ncbi:1-acyl-sn-glycerol-3-phosphate acyltransferase [Kroppenstedtia sanguinis]|uniref:1-acyl-sn-glycerol-3-phosphate acyltransferase n=1 Tax=Kroppenstedtia sanguinis TaxID=1380684 RepID=A0ABW4CB42_9BACL